MGAPVGAPAGSEDCKLLKVLVGERGFEPPTPWSRTRCSTRLSHSPTEVSPNILLQFKLPPPMLDLPLVCDHWDRRQTIPHPLRPVSGSRQGNACSPKSCADSNSHPFLNEISRYSVCFENRDAPMSECVQPGGFYTECP